jgi:hypothetical protein
MSQRRRDAVGCGREAAGGALELEGSMEISELCRREGINPTQYYLWK